MSTTTTPIISNQASISAFNRGPVITQFEPPASCLSTLTFGGSMYFGHWGSGYVDKQCYPNNTATLGASAWDVYYYSPAQCPVGWYQAYTATSSFPGYNHLLSVGASTTAVVCCPSGFKYPTDGVGHACRMSFSSTTSILKYISPIQNDNTFFSTDANSALKTTVTDDTYTIYGDGIPVWWQSSDLKAFSAATGPTPSSGSPTTTGTQQTLSNTSQTSTPTGSSSEASSSSGLSSGAKIGIGVGIPLAVIAIGAVAFFLFWRRRKRQQVAQTEEEHKYPGQTGEPTNEAVVQELQGNNTLYDPHNSMGKPELPGS